MSTYADREVIRMAVGSLCDRHFDMLIVWRIERAKRCAVCAAEDAERTARRYAALRMMTSNEFGVLRLRALTHPGGFEGALDEMAEEM